MDGISDVTMSALQHALGGVSRRAEVRANNIANANTPGFRASTVAFERALAEALAEGGAPPPPTVTGTNAAPGANDNNVSLESEMTGGIKDNLLYDTFVHGYTYKVGLLRTAIRERPE